MNSERKEFILTQIKAQEKVLKENEKEPQSDKYKGALKALTTLNQELRKEEDLRLKIEKEEFERTVKTNSELHRMEMEQKEFELKKDTTIFERESKVKSEEHRMAIETRDIDLREFETEEKIAISKKELDIKSYESQTRFRDQGILSLIDSTFKMIIMCAAFKMESTGHLIPRDKLGLHKQL